MGNFQKNIHHMTQVDQLAAGLVSLKLGIQSKIAIIASNTYEWVVTQFATAKAGLVLVNINTAFQVTELEYCLSLGDCVAVIYAENFVRQDYYKMLLEIVPEIKDVKPGELKSFRLPMLQHIIVIGDAAQPGTMTYSQLMNSATQRHMQEMQLIASKLQFDAPVNIQFTSGTTGKPKGALLSHFNVVNNANACGHELGFHEQNDSICLNVPLVHCFGCVIGTMAAVVFGATIVMPAPSFDAVAALEAISKQRCTVMYGTPTMYIDILNHQEAKRYDVSSMQKGVMAGAPCPPEVLKNAMAKLNIERMHIFYGTTECSPVITGSRPEGPIGKWIRTVGKPLGHVEVKIVDNENRVVPLNNRGQLCARGYLVFLGYYNNEQKIEEEVQNGWYYTGDEALMSEDGTITITGRIRDMICRGGENVYPLEIEDFLYKHPDIEEVQVVGVPDRRLGEEACAWIKLKPGKTTTEDEIKEFCRRQISHFKVPRYILFVDSFPKTMSGKIQKFKMAEESRKKLNL
ncbi:medium-chain acyl-CoA ligase ACSF2, mitochondrial [Ixodes scapularis]